MTKAKRYNSFTEGYKTYDTSKGHGNAKNWKKAFEERMGFDEATEIIEAQEDSPYHILGLDAGLHSATEIKAAFRTMIRKWHPDNNPDNILEATEMSKKIIAAYTLLSS